MSNMSGLPPASVIRAAAMASLQDIAVRLINLPSGLSNNPQPVKLTGTVIGNTPEGHVQLNTDRGVITMMLKDRATLPVGQSFDLEIPAGRAPQNASLKTAQNQAGTQANPHGNPHSNPQTPTQILSSGLASSIGSALRLDRAPSLKPDELMEAIANLKPGQDIPTAAPLQAGQTLRLTPLPLFNQTAPAQIPIPSGLPLAPQEMFTALLKMVEQATDIPLQTRQNIAQALSRIDLTTLAQPISQNVPLSTPVTTQDEPQVLLQKLMQALDLPLPPALRNGALPNTSAPLFNPTKPLDVQIVAFQNGNFGTTLAQTQSGQAAPQGTVQNMVVMQPQQVSAQAGDPTPPSPPALLGQVTGFTPQGQPILSLPIPGSPQPQNYVVQFVANNVVQGAPVLVSPLTATPHVIQPGIVPFSIGQDAPLSAWVQPETWESLQALISHVNQLNPALAQPLAQMLPSPAQPQNMGALATFFLAMMRSGDTESWLNENTVSLLKQAGKLDALRSLAGDAALFSRLETTPLPNEWRATMLPFWHNQQVQKLPLYYKQWNDEDAQDQEDQRRKKLRFLFALNLSRMGEVQVDGFMQKEKLDMILRTKSIVSPNMQQALKKIYHKSMERSNLSGEITFQFKPEQWVNIEMPVGTPA